MPAPKPMRSTGSPGARRPASAASASAIGIDAAEVLPVVARMFDGAGVVDAELGAGRRDDPGVGLVGDEEPQVVCRQARVRERSFGRLDHDAHRPSEHLRPVHLDRAAVVGVQDVAQRSVGAQVEAEHAARTLAALEHHRAGTVAEQDGRRAVLPVDDARHRLRADQQHAVQPGSQEAVGRHQAVDEPGAGGVEVDGAAADARARAGWRWRRRAWSRPGSTCTAARGRCRRPARPPPPSPAGRPRCPGRWWCRRRAAHGSRCARRSRRRWCRGCPPGRRW